MKFWSDRFYQDFDRPLFNDRSEGERSEQCVSQKQDLKLFTSFDIFLKHSPTSSCGSRQRDTMKWMNHLRASFRG